MLRLGLATTVLVGAALILEGSCTFMTLFAFLVVVSRIYAPFDQCLMLIAELFSAKTAAARMKGFYEEPLAQGGEKYEPVGHDVAFEDVSLLLRSRRRRSWDGVTFTAREGEVTALVGPSGSGKSTCARLAARLWDADAGHVTVGGVDVAAVDPEVLLGDFSVVFQDVLLFDDTVMGNNPPGSARRHRRGGARGGARGQLRRVREPPAAGLRHDDRRERRAALRRRAPADLHRPRPAQGRAGRAPGRGHAASLDVENETQVQEALSAPARPARPSS